MTTLQYPTRSIAANIVSFIHALSQCFQLQLFYLNAHKKYWWYTENVRFHLVVASEKVLSTPSVSY